MLKARIIEVLSRDSSDMHGIERVANELEKLFDSHFEESMEKMVTSAVNVMVKLYAPENTEVNDGQRQTEKETS